MQLTINNFVRAIPWTGIMTVTTGALTAIATYKALIPDTIWGVNTAALITGAVTVLTWLELAAQKAEAYEAANGTSTPAPAPASTPAIPAPSTTNANPSAPVLGWTAFQALNGTQSTAVARTVVATAVNPSSQFVFYAIVGSNGQVELTNIAPGSTS